MTNPEQRRSIINSRKYSPFRTSLLVLAVGLLLPGGLWAQQTPTGKVDFNRDVKPLLSSRCFMCHGPDENTRESGLRLDTFAGATEDLGGYAAVQPGDPDASELIQRIISDDEGEVMPPADHGKPLTAEEKATLRQWIANGAVYDRHWSYVSPALPAVPTADPAFANWVRNDIDRFALRKMRENQLEPSPLADRLTMARRLALDLTGLPPTVEQADAFASSSDPNAYEKLVDKLLASDAYGEHWAAMWLDLARYADSAGYAEDRQRTIWAYRDYVIRSFQKNQAFDDFTIEQLAGDLLPNPTDEAMIATAFHRNTLTNSEGGTADEEFRSAAVVDRTNTTMAVWMGTTMACAQCHTHKYDPITQEEYFQVYAILNSTADADRPNEQPTYPVFSTAQLAQRQQIQSSIDQLTQQLAQLKGQPAETRSNRLNREQIDWEGRMATLVGEKINGRTIRIQLPGRSRILQLAEVEVNSGDTNVARLGKASQSSTYGDGQAGRAIDGNTNGIYDQGSVAHTNTQANPWWQVKLDKTHAIDSIVIWNRTDNELHTRLNGFEVQVLNELDEVIWKRSFANAQKEAQSISCGPLPASIAAILPVPSKDRSAQQQQQIRDHFSRTAGSEAKLESKIADLEAELAAIRPETTVPIMKELEQPRTTHVQIRGNYQSLGSQVKPGVPEVFHQIDSEGDASPDRMALAHWLVDRNNPLTARVVVNRYWQRLFGTGLVRTSEDFGAQGDLPTHPQLLDYLAVKYMEDEWDNRALLKRIVMSATYRQQSAVTPERRQLDPDNRWLARGPRFRITAEMVRDQALAASGLLSRKMYGPPVKPPAPELDLKAAFSGKLAWNAATGEDRYRRAIYTLWRRSSPYPSMETFDVSNREVCDLRRISTNTPLQALVTLNDEAYIEAAQSLARSMMQHSENPAQATQFGFRRVLIRKPRQQELDELIQLFESTKAHFANQPEEAKLLATDPLHPVPDGTNLVDLASWTTVANVLLNLDEVFMKP